MSGPSSSQVVVDPADGRCINEHGFHPNGLAALYTIKASALLAEIAPKSQRSSAEEASFPFFSCGEIPPEIQLRIWKAARLNINRIVEVYTRGLLYEKLSNIYDHDPHPWRSSKGIFKARDLNGWLLQTNKKEREDVSSLRLAAPMAKIEFDKGCHNIFKGDGFVKATENPEDFRFNFETDTLFINTRCYNYFMLRIEGESLLERGVAQILDDICGDALPLVKKHLKILAGFTDAMCALEDEERDCYASFWRPMLGIPAGYDEGFGTPSDDEQEPPSYYDEGFGTPSDDEQEPPSYDEESCPLLGFESLEEIVVVVLDGRQPFERVSSSSCWADSLNEADALDDDYCRARMKEVNDALDEISAWNPEWKRPKVRYVPLRYDNDCDPDF